MGDPEKTKPEDVVEKRVIEKPDLATPGAFDLWLDEHVQKPFAGFEDKKHDDGTPFSLAEQIQATKDQLRKIADEFPEMGRTLEQIQNVLVLSVQGLQLQEDTPPHSL